ncbi:MAG: MBL fold metallo-hydrolase [Eubacteriales bacterium]|nr:MBL fold metallo-hydrolase [Lachnospiraceae bacterium]MDO5127227.1 MBL fold metallo-hydrolase [Eubacteriales bacterium]
MKLMSIASGSSGNCIFVGSDKTSVLVDVGISRKKIAEGLHNNDFDFSDLQGVLITHEHIDHVRALGVISRSYNLPIYATEDTISSVLSMSSLGEIDRGLFHSIEPDMPFSIGDLSIQAHSVWHDAADPVCYSFFNKNRKICIATDMGDYDDYIVNAISDSDALLLESNHDIRMLQVGPYSYPLKQRILGKRGHLSNEACGKLLRSVLNDHMKAVFLGHLSKENNYPELAYETVKAELMGNQYFKDVREINLAVASRTEVGKCIEI